MQTRPSIYLRWQGYYDYTPGNVKKYVLREPRLAGVYKIAELQPFGRLVPFYVGETLNLYKALMKHLDNDEENACLKKELKGKICCFRFAPLTEQEERDAVLYSIFEHYHPICNHPAKIPKTYLVNINYQ